jgi:hypothetical protein
LRQIAFLDGETELIEPTLAEQVLARPVLEDPQLRLYA